MARYGEGTYLKPGKKLSIGNRFWKSIECDKVEYRIWLYRVFYSSSFKTSKIFFQIGFHVKRLNDLWWEIDRSGSRTSTSVSILVMKEVKK